MMKKDDTSELDRLAEQTFQHDLSRLPVPSSTPSARLTQKLASSNGIDAAIHLPPSHLGWLGSGISGSAKLISLALLMAAAGLTTLYLTHILEPASNGQPGVSRSPQIEPQNASSSPADTLTAHSSIQDTARQYSASRNGRDDHSRRYPSAKATNGKKLHRFSLKGSQATSDHVDSLSSMSLPPLLTTTISDSAKVSLSRHGHRRRR